MKGATNEPTPIVQRHSIWANTGNIVQALNAANGELIETGVGPISQAVTARFAVWGSIRTRSFSRPPTLAWLPWTRMGKVLQAGMRYADTSKGYNSTSGPAGGSRQGHPGYERVRPI